MRYSQSGFTLIELMVAIAIIAILGALALPAYNSYIATAETGQLASNLKTMQIFQEDYFLRTGGYANDLADVAAITAEIGWEPRSDDNITYAIAASDGSFYQATATSPSGATVCMRYPDNVLCP